MEMKSTLLIFSILVALTKKWTYQTDMKSTNKMKNANICNWQKDVFSIITIKNRTFRIRENMWWARTLTIIIIATPTVRRQRPTPKVINWNSSCNVQKEVFIRFSWGQISIDDFWCLSLPSDSCRGYDDYSQCFKKMWTWCYHYPFGDPSW